MARSRTLLERLAEPGPPGERQVRESPEGLANSVLAHLSDMLNTRRGSAPTAPDYGIAELADLKSAFPNAIDELERSIESTIERYEPRLALSHIEHSPNPDDPLTVRFKIVGRIVAGDDAHPVWFETTIDSSGKVKVRR